MTDLMTQTRDYLEAVRTPVGAGSVVDQTATGAVAPSSRKGPVIALVAALAVILLGVVAALFRPTAQSVPQSDLVDVVISENEGTSYYAVGFDVEGLLCAEAGALSGEPVGSRASCVASEQRVIVTYLGQDSVAIAGWVPTHAVSATAIFDGDIRRTLELTSIPGRDLSAFGAIEEGQPQTLEIEMRDETGEVIQRYFPSLADPVPEGWRSGASNSAGAEYVVPSEGWRVIEESLTPDFSGLPLPERYKDTIISFATYQASPGSSTVFCANNPQTALEQLGPQDALISVLEMAEVMVDEYPDRRRATGIYEDEPEQLYPYIGEMNNDSCYDRANEGRVAPLFHREYIFNDQGRAFVVTVGIGGQATKQTEEQVWTILDGLTFEPRP